MIRVFLVAILCITISSCSFFSMPVNNEETIRSSINRHINTVSGLQTAKVTDIDKGGKKYVITDRFEATPPMDCGVSPFDGSPNFCGMEFGLPGSIATRTYFVDAKGVIFETGYGSEEIPVPSQGGGVNYLR